MIILLLVVFIDAVFSDVPTEKKLLQINQWHSFDFNSSAVLDVHVFATCEKFTMVFATEQEELTRLRFRFDDDLLKKLDVDSLASVAIPRTAKVWGGCRETRRKALRINVTSTNDSVEFRVAQQVIRRPFTAISRKLMILIPQQAPCCLIRGLFLTDLEGLVTSTMSPLERVSPKFHVFVKNSTKKPVYGTKIPRLPPDNPVAELVPTTASTEATFSENLATTTRAKVIKSWTHLVNEEWSMTFVLCSSVIAGIMGLLVLFGIFMFIYLMTKPKGGKSPFAIDC